MIISNKTPSLFRTLEHWYTLHELRTSRPGRLDFGVCVTAVAREEGDTPPTGLCYVIPHSFRSRDDAYCEAQRVARELAKGDLHPQSTVQKESFRGYCLYGSARFIRATSDWVPALTIEAMAGSRKGQKQEVIEQNALFYRNACPTADRAARFALDYGKQMVMGFVGGLKI